MKQAVKEALKKVAPSLGVKVYRKFRPAKLMWMGNYPSWEAAMREADGYQKPSILEAVRASVLKVKNGEAVCERDSVLYDKIEYFWPILACLLEVALENKGHLHLVDFGGSLGSSYFQNRNFLGNLESLSWSVVEQSHFVACGQQEIAEGPLRFFYSLEEAIAFQRPSVLLLSGVIQCLDRPYEWIEKFVSYGIDYILLDRTAFATGAERLTLQHVPASIYEAVYPAWFLEEQKLVDAFKGYTLVVDFENNLSPVPLEDHTQGYWRGLFFRKRH